MLWGRPIFPLMALLNFGPELQQKQRQTLLTGVPEFKFSCLYSHYIASASPPLHLNLWMFSRSSTHSMQEPRAALRTVRHRICSLHSFHITKPQNSQDSKEELNQEPARHGTFVYAKRSWPTATAVIFFTCFVLHRHVLPTADCKAVH